MANAQSGAGRKRRHHFLPVFQLKYFSDPSQGGVWTHDRLGRITPNPKCLPATEIGAQTELYTITKESGERSDLYETWLADKIDGPASKVFPKLLAGTRLSRQEQSDISAYVMSRDLRTPKARELAIAVENAAARAAWSVLKSDIPATRLSILKSSGLDFSEQELAEFFADFEPEAGNASFTDFISRHINDGAARLYRTTWFLLDALVGEEFITTDHGVLKFRGGFDNPVPHSLAWVGQADHWIFPLTPNTALVMEPNGQPGRGVARPEFLSTINHNLAKQADEFVFARKPMPWIIREWSRRDS